MVMWRPSRVVWVFDGVMPGMMLPVRSRTKPNTSNSGTSDSIIANTASYSATSTTWPAPPFTSLWRSAISAPSAPHSAAIESPIEIPVFTGGRSGKPVT